MHIESFVVLSVILLTWVLVVWLSSPMEFLGSVGLSTAVLVSLVVISQMLVVDSVGYVLMVILVLCIVGFPLSIMLDYEISYRPVRRVVYRDNTEVMLNARANKIMGI